VIGKEYGESKVGKMSKNLLREEGSEKGVSSEVLGWLCPE
jgi:hypothetical protein